MTLNARHNFERFFLFINNVLIILKIFFYMLKNYFFKKVLALNVRHNYCQCI